MLNFLAHLHNKLDLLSAIDHRKYQESVQRNYLRQIAHKEAEQELAKHQNVIQVYDITGDYDIAIIARFKDRKALDTFIKSVLNKSYIKRTVTNIALNVVKEDLRVKEFNF